MRKLLSFIFLLLCISLPFLSGGGSLNFLAESVKEVECYYNFNNTFLTECDAIKNGEGSIVYTTSDYYFNNKEKFDFGMSGITFVLNRDISLDKLKDKLCLKEISISKQNNIYGFSKYFNNSISLQNKKVNTQILVKEDKIYIGSPILLGSY